MHMILVIFHMADTSQDSLVGIEVTSLTGITAHFFFQVLIHKDSGNTTNDGEEILKVPSFSEYRSLKKT